MLAGGAEKKTETHPAAGKPRHDPFGALPSPHQSVRLREELLRKHFLERAPLRGCTPYRREEQDERLVQQINERPDQALYSRLLEQAHRCKGATAQLASALT